MATMVLDRAVLPEPLFSCFEVPRIAMIRKPDGDVTLSPVVNPDDYDNDTDYINAIPGMSERLLAARNAPASEFKPVPRKFFNHESWGHSYDDPRKRYKKLF